LNDKNHSNKHKCDDDIIEPVKSFEEFLHACGPLSGGWRRARERPSAVLGSDLAQITQRLCLSSLRHGTSSRDAL
jgi:hypothetical protein